MGRHVLLLALAALVVVTHVTRAAAEPMRIVQTLQGGGPGIEGLDGPRSVAISPDEQHVYVASRDGSLALFERDVTSGRLRQLAAYWNGQDGVVGLEDPSRVIVSGDGANVYVSSETPPAVVAFARDAETGALAFIEAITDGFYCPPGGPRGPTPCPLFMALTPDDSRLLVLDGGEFDREPGTGALGTRHPFPVSSDLEFAQSPDGRHYYESHRAYPDGDVSYVSTRPSGAESWTRDSVFGSWYLARLSPDGARLYGFNRDPEVKRVCWAAVDAETGALGMQSCRSEQISFGPFAAAMAPDGTFYFATSTTLYRYAPDPITGALGPPDPVSMPSYSDAIEASPDSRFIYAVVSGSDRLTVIPEPSAIASGVATLLVLARAARARRCVSA